MAFPATLDSFTNPTGADKLNSPDHPTQHANANDAIENIEAKVGVNASAVTTTHDYKLSGVTGSDKASSLAGTEGLTNKTINGNTITAGTGTLTLSTFTLQASGNGTVQGSNTGDQSVPVVATGAEVNTGTDNAKFVSSKAVADSNLVLTTKTQTLFNKSIDAPTFTIRKDGNSAADDVKFTMPALSGHQTITLTSNTGVMVLADNTQTLQNKAIGAGSSYVGGLIAAQYGGTGNNSYTLGDILYASAGTTLTKLAGNITTTKMYLSQTGNGAVSAAPAWTDTLVNAVLNGAGGTTAGEHGYDGTDKAIYIGDGTTKQSIYTSSWKSFTPAYTNLTVGNATNNGSYVRIGKFVAFRTYLKLGNTSSVGTDPTLTLPLTVAVYNGSTIISTSVRLTAGGVTVLGQMNSEGIISVLDTSGTYAVQTQVTATVPGTWTTNDEIEIQAFYETL